MKLPFLSEQLDEISSEERIAINKALSLIDSESKKRAKLDKCMLCEKEQTSYCNSHTIPKFVLRNISDDGHYITGFSLSVRPKDKQRIGLNKTITFNTICERCDNEQFQKYENPETYLKNLDNDVLCEIALKNYLRTYSKRLIEKEYYSIMLEYGLPVEDKLLMIDMDIQEAIEHVKYAKRKNKYYLIDELELNYKVPFAYQGEIYLTNGFDEKVINDIYSLNEKYKMQSLHICVFPLEDKTKIILFIKDGDTRYRAFYKKYKSLSLEEKLYVINYIILIYEEDWVTTPKYEFVRNDKATKDIIATYSEGFSDYYVTLSDTINENILHTNGKVFNFLEQENIN